jgi:hypothetical protein
MQLFCAEIDAANADLTRLSNLLAEASGSLTNSFGRIQTGLDDVFAGRGRNEIDGGLGQAVMAMQFQDLATQLIGFTQRRLSTVRTIAETGDDDAAVAMMAERAAPVRQESLDSGDIELF